MTISIMGFGHVGRAIYKLFASQVQSMIDPAIEFVKSEPGIVQEVKTKSNPNPVKVRSSVNINEQAASMSCDFVFICVPTPSLKDGRCDTSIVESAVQQLSDQQIGIIKSTVDPGTTEALSRMHGKRLVFSPEYFGESPYYLPPEWSPAAWPFHIFGGPKALTSDCVELFKPVFNPRTFYAQTDSLQAELVKYMENAWGAMKVTWANEWFDICQGFGADYDEVRELWALDPRVEKMHTAVYKNKRGYAGKCFPKDIKAIIAAAQNLGIGVPIHETVDKTNEKRTSKKA